MSCEKEKGKRKKRKRVGRRRRYFAVFVKSFFWCMTILFIIGIGTGIWVVKNIIAEAPDITKESVIPKGYKSVVLDSRGNKTAELIAEGSNRIWIDIDRVPQYVQDAFVAIEDARFYEHHGIDVQGIARAFYKGVTNGFHFTEGASTITQQLLKNSVFDFMSEHDMTDKLTRKIQEQYLALILERDMMTKEEILEAYLNTINLGQNTLGIQAAANRYFGKDVTELNLSEAAVIAGITKNPVAYNPLVYPDANRKRQEAVLKNMLEQEFIDQEAYEEALQDDVYSRIKTVDESTDKQVVYSYFTEAVLEEVLVDLQMEKGYTCEQAYQLLYYGGLTIESTQDSVIQAIMDEETQNEENYPAEARVALEYSLTVVKPDGERLNYSKENMIDYFQEKGMEEFDLLFNGKEEAQACINEYKSAFSEMGDTIYESVEFIVQPQVSMVVMDQYTGAVKGIVGGRGEKEKNMTLNRATDTMRQPGSTFKVVSTYAPALDALGMSLATTQFDAPYAYENGRAVRNWNGEAYYGWAPLRRGIEQSMNVVAVRTITDTTPELAYRYALAFGFTSLVGEVDQNGNTDVVQPMALGGLTNGVSNLELTAAYAAIANEGVYTEPVFYTRVLDRDGNVLLEKQLQHRRVVKETTAWLLTNAMKDVVNQGTGTIARFDGMHIAGKTGTTSKYNDVWFVGYTPYYTAGIWTGYDNNHKLERGERSFHEVIWEKVMSRMHEELPDTDFEMPEGIVSCEICSQSGRLPIPGICDGCVRTEYFAEGTVPEEYCDIHVVGVVCKESGQMATDQCFDVEERILTLMPADLQAASSSIGVRYLVAPACTLHPGGI